MPSFIIILLTTQGCRSSKTKCKRSACTRTRSMCIRSYTYPPTHRHVFLSLSLYLYLSAVFAQLKKTLLINLFVTNQRTPKHTHASTATWSEEGTSVTAVRNILMAPLMSREPSGLDQPQPAAAAAAARAVVAVAVEYRLRLQGCRCATRGCCKRTSR